MSYKQFTHTETHDHVVIHWEVTDVWFTSDNLHVTIGATLNGKRIRSYIADDIGDITSIGKGSMVEGEKTIVDRLFKRVQRFLEIK